MPSSKTTNYKLSQWVKTDKVLMDDFNADNAKIDAAIKAVDAKADGLSSSKAERSDLTALQTTVAGKGNCRIETFTYAGDRTSTETGLITKAIRFSAKPVFFIITGPQTLVLGGGAGDKANCVYHTSSGAYHGTLTATWSGNSVSLYGESRAVPNKSGDSYLVTAFFAMDA